MKNIYALFLIIAISGMLLAGTVAPALADKGVIRYMNPGKSVGIIKVVTTKEVTPEGEVTTKDGKISKMVITKENPTQGHVFKTTTGLFDSRYSPKVGDPVTFTQGKTATNVNVVLPPNFPETVYYNDQRIVVPVDTSVGAPTDIRDLLKR